MVTKAYRPIDIHTGQGWPANVPSKMTAGEIERAFRRLFRWAMGRPVDRLSKTAITSGNRYATRVGWDGNVRCYYLNPDQGWKNFIHHLSHDLDYLANSEVGHSKHHARFERRMIAEVVKRGYLDGRLKDAEPAPAPIVTAEETKLKRLERIAQLAHAWERKQSRATNAIAKLTKERKRIERALLKEAT